MIWAIVGAIAWGIAGIGLMRYLAVGEEEISYDPRRKGLDLLLPLFLCLVFWPFIIAVYGISKFAYFIVTYKR